MTGTVRKAKMEPSQYQIHSNDKILSFILLIGGDLFLVFCFVMVTKGLSSSADSIFALGILILFIILWNALFIYAFSNIPITLDLSNEGLTITYWYPKKTVMFPWHEVHLEKMGLNPIRFIKVKDPKSKRLRLLLLNGWDTRYGDLVDKIENYQSIFSNPPVHQTG